MSASTSSKQPASHSGSSLKTIKVADYIADRLVHQGVSQVFMLTGGGAMHLNNGLGKHPKLRCLFHHHEQACAIAAEGYARASGKLPVINVTTGPGGLNTLTGVMGQWTDSVPAVYISGQVKFETTTRFCPEINLRQLGDQEVDIVRIVEPITKWAHFLNNPQDTRWAVDRAVYLATHGRPGPVWIDVPMNIQGSMIDPDTLREYSPVEDETVLPKLDNLLVQQTLKALQRAKRPVIVAGHGIRASKARAEFLRLAAQLKIPLLGTFNAVDLIPSDNPFYVGRIGSVGDRAGNFALQNADVVLCIGTRNNVRQASYGWSSFARSAQKIVVDIDAAELRKPIVKPDLAIQSDAREFIQTLSDLVTKSPIGNKKDWLDWCLERRHRYPVVLPEYRTAERLNLYVFVEALCKAAGAGDQFVAGDGSACVGLYQAGTFTEKQRAFWNSGCAAMGYDLSAAIGAAVAHPSINTICLAGDGSLQLNIQELQTVAHYRLPVKLLVLNNGGYISIKQTQRNFFGLPYVGCDSSSGVSFPDIVRIAEAYGLPAARLSKADGLEQSLRTWLAQPGPGVMEIELDTDYSFSPKLSSERKPDGRMVSKPLEDMFPFLDRQEFKNNMLVPLMPEE